MLSLFEFVIEFIINLRILIKDKVDLNTNYQFSINIKRGGYLKRTPNKNIQINLSPIDNFLQRTF